QVGHQHKQERRLFPATLLARPFHRSALGKFTALSETKRTALASKKFTSTAGRRKTYEKSSTASGDRSSTMEHRLGAEQRELQCHRQWRSVRNRFRHWCP